MHDFVNNCLFDVDVDNMKNQKGIYIFVKNRILCKLIKNYVHDEETFKSWQRQNYLFPERR